MNPLELYKRIDFNGVDTDLGDMSYAGSKVKVYVPEGTDEKSVKKFKESFDKLDPLSVSFVYPKKPKAQTREGVSIQKIAQRTAHENLTERVLRDERISEKDHKLIQNLIGGL